MFDIEQFEDASHQNGIRYWLAHDYMRALGYESWSSFKTVIQRAQASCLHLGIETEDTFMPCLLADGLQQAKNTAHEVGREVRDVMLRSSGTAPEDLALEGDIKQVRKQIKTANREMKKLDTPPKKKR